MSNNANEVPATSITKLMGQDSGGNEVGTGRTADGSVESVAQKVVTSETVTYAVETTRWLRFRGWLKWSPPGGGLTSRKERPARRQEANQVPSVNDLIQLSRSSRAEYGRARKIFEQQHGEIFENYIARHIHAGAFLLNERVRFSWFRRRRYRIETAYENVAIDTRLDEMLRKVMTEERRSAITLTGRPHAILVQTAYSLMVYLYNILDSMQSGTCGPERVKKIAASAQAELASLKEFQVNSARRRALSFYLLGLPIGGLACSALIFWAAHSPSVNAITSDSDGVAACLFSGAAGGIISVMARVHSGKRAEVDSNQNRAVILLAGCFRPIIGAVFGGALYVLISSGILPLAMPTGIVTPTGSGAGFNKTQKTSLYFTGLAFLAGFSERWAQDTIVSSQPKFSLKKAAR
jgi:hypothetical protein